MPEQNTNRALTEAAADEWKVLPSGLTVLVRPMPGYSGTHVIYATRFGSIDRDFRVDGREVHLPAGVAHFLEHKMFEDEDGDAFAKFAKTGANANAFTSFDRTCYLFTATEQLDESLDVLLGMVGRPYFTEQTIAKEQGIIGQEIKMYDDSPDWRLITGLFECLYHSHPIRSDIAGTVESIAEITPEMLYDCCKAFYAPNNMVLAAAGSTSMEQILAACARHGLLDPRPEERVQRLWADEPMTLATAEKRIRMPVSKPCFGLGFKWQETLCMVFLCGLINIIITVTKIRKMIIQAIPEVLQNAIGGGIGASVIISQHFGGHAYSRMKNSIRTAMLSFLLISLDGFDMVTN